MYLFVPTQIREDLEKLEDLEVVVEEEEEEVIMLQLQLFFLLTRCF